MTTPHPHPTPGFWHILQEATSDAIRRGHEHVGTEHLLYVLATTPQSFSRNILDHLAVREIVEKGLDDLMNSDDYANAGSNVVRDESGEIIGHLVVGPDGKPMLERLSG